MGQPRALPARQPLPEWLKQLRARWSAELIETHISWLLLTDDTVYKFKRPVKFSFIDYSTRQLRQHWCDEEVRLGRRYADIYRGVVVDEESGEPAVLMRRFAEDLRADHMCQAGQLLEPHVRGLVDHMLAVHAASPSAPAGGQLGSPELIAQQVGNTLAELRSQSGIDYEAIDQLAEWLDEELARLSPLMVQRQVQGFIREGHGDLHLANVIVWHGEAVAFDGIEFDDGLRWIDIAQELGFTYADLLRFDQPALAVTLVHEWLLRTGDANGLALLRLHACHKALVRAMVAGMQDDMRTRDVYLHTGIRIVTAGATPRLLITHGLSGSGKSTFARDHIRTDRSAATVWLRADVERKRIHGLNPGTAHPAGLGDDIYSSAATERTYAHLASMAATLLASGWSVLVDATFLERTRRDAFREVASAASAQFGVVACTAPESELRARVAARRHDVSDADTAVLESQLRNFVPLGADETADLWSPEGQQ